MNPDEFHYSLNKIANILLWCLIFSFALLIFWFLFYLLAGNLAFNIHASFFGLTRHEFDLMMYGGLGIMKILVIVFFLFPWIAIKIVLRKKE